MATMGEPCEMKTAGIAVWASGVFTAPPPRSLGNGNHISVVSAVQCRHRCPRVGNFLAAIQTDFVGAAAQGEGTRLIGMVATEKHLQGREQRLAHNILLQPRERRCVL